MNLSILVNVAGVIGYSILMLALLKERRALHRTSRNLKQQIDRQAKEQAKFLVATMSVPELWAQLRERPTSHLLVVIDPRTTEITVWHDRTKGDSIQECRAWWADLCEREVLEMLRK